MTEPVCFLEHGQCVDVWVCVLVISYIFISLQAKQYFPEINVHQQTCQLFGYSIDSTNHHDKQIVECRHRRPILASTV